MRALVVISFIRDDKRPHSLSTWPRPRAEARPPRFKQRSHLDLISRFFPKKRKTSFKASCDRGNAMTVPFSVDDTTDSFLCAPRVSLIYSTLS